MVEPNGKPLGDVQLRNEQQVYNLAEYAEMREGAQQSSTQPEEEDHEFEIGWADVTDAGQPIVWWITEITRG
jgi:hypothetical protein